MKCNKKIISSILLGIFLVCLIPNLANISGKNGDPLNHEKSVQINKDQTPETSDAFIPPPPTGVELQDFTWNFWNGTTKAFHYQVASSDGGGLMGVSYFNITSMPYVFNATGEETWDHCVQLQELRYDSTINDLIPNINNLNLINVSIINFTDSTFFPCNPEGEEQDGFDINLLFMLNAFIPTNGTEGLALDWSATLLKEFYKYMLGELDIDIRDETKRNIYFKNATTGAYINMTYDAKGILSEGEFLMIDEGESHIVKVKVDDNLNPVDEITWDVKEGDILYYGLGQKPIRMNITKIINETIYNSQIGAWISSETVYANISYWYDAPLEGWYSPGGPPIMRIGAANEELPYLPFLQPILPFIFPKNPDTEALVNVILMTSDYDHEGIAGDDWIRVYNATSYIYFNLTSSGRIAFIKAENYPLLMDYNTIGMYKKNTTVIDDSQLIWSFDFRPIGVDKFNITLNISVINNPGDTRLFFSRFAFNPVNISLAYGAVFMDVMVNCSANLNQNNFAPINITIEFDHTKYKNMKVFYFNASANNNKGEWIEILFTNLGSGVIVFTVNHTSIFAFTNVPIAAILALIDDDDDDDDDDATAIPFGNYYLIFVVIALIGLIIYKKRKITKTTK